MNVRMHGAVALAMIGLIGVSAWAGDERTPLRNWLNSSRTSSAERDGSWWSKKSRGFFPFQRSSSTSTSTSAAAATAAVMTPLRWVANGSKVVYQGTTHVVSAAGRTTVGTVKRVLPLPKPQPAPLTGSRSKRKTQQTGWVRSMFSSSKPKPAERDPVQRFFDLKRLDP